MMLNLDSFTMNILNNIYIIIRLISKSYIRLLKVKRLSNNKNNLLKLDHF